MRNVPQEAEGDENDEDERDTEKVLVARHKHQSAETA